mgnify:CR=1 FL=1
MLPDCRPAQQRLEQPLRHQSRAQDSEPGLDADGIPEGRTPGADDAVNDFGDFDLPPDPKGLDNLDKTVTKAPQNANRVSQDEVDQIFSQEEIDALFD